MSTSTVTPAPQEAAPIPPSNNRVQRRVLFIVAATIVVIFVGSALLAAGLLAGGSQTAEPSTTDPAGSGPATTEPADEVVVAPTSTPAARENVGPLLLSFAETWRTSNWDAMAALATDDVVSTAKEWYSDGGDPNITDENIEFVLDTCQTGASGGTECFFTYAPPEGFGLIFDITMVDGEAGLRVSELTFGGDAG